MDAVAIDAVFPQFCTSTRTDLLVPLNSRVAITDNNYCSLTYYPGQFNFDQWDTWARTVSVSKNTKVYIGALASSTAGSYGYVDSATLINITLAVRSQYSSFGGVMFWDASQAWSASSICSLFPSFPRRTNPCPFRATDNGRIDSQVKNAIRQNGGTTTTQPVTTTTTTQPTTTTVNSGSCAGVSAWVNDVVVCFFVSSSDCFV